MRNDYYVYIHINLETGIPFYIGKGCGGRVYDKFKRSDYWKRIVNKYGYDIFLLKDKMSEIDAFDEEKYWIKRIGRLDKGDGPLINMTDGGDGISGYILTESDRLKISLSKIGNKYTLGFKHKVDSIKKRSDMLRGVPRSECVKYKLSIAQKKNIDNKSCNKKLILSLNDGIYYDTIKMASRAYGYEYKNFHYLLKKNKINFIYV